MATVSAQEKLFLKQIGKRIAKFRKSRSMTQEALSDLCDMEQSAIARIESGNSNITALNLRKISNALNVPMKKFF